MKINKKFPLFLEEKGKSEELNKNTI